MFYWNCYQHPQPINDLHVKLANTQQPHDTIDHSENSFFKQVHTISRKRQLYFHLATIIQYRFLLPFKSCKWFGWLGKSVTMETLSCKFPQYIYTVICCISLYHPFAWVFILLDAQNSHIPSSIITPFFE